MARKVIIVLAIAAMVAATGSAFGWVKETCQQSIDGTWDVEIWGGETAGEQCWGQCSLTVSSNGTIVPGGSYVDCTGQGSSITGGQLSISTGCVIEGVIETDGGSLTVVNGGILGDKIYFGKGPLGNVPPEEQ